MNEGYFRRPDKTTWIEGRVKPPKPRPKTNREVHEEAAGVGLCIEFFALNGIDPDAPYPGPQGKDGKPE